MAINEGNPIDPYGDPTTVEPSGIAVWIIIDDHRHGLSDQELIQKYPELTLSDLHEAYNYYSANRAVIDHIIANQDD